MNAIEILQAALKRIEAIRTGTSPDKQKKQWEKEAILETQSALAKCLMFLS